MPSRRRQDRHRPIIEQLHPEDVHGWHYISLALRGYYAPGMTDGEPMRLIRTGDDQEWHLYLVDIERRQVATVERPTLRGAMLALDQGLRHEVLDLAADELHRQ